MRIMNSCHGVGSDRLQWCETNCKALQNLSESNLLPQDFSDAHGRMSQQAIVDTISNHQTVHRCLKSAANLVMSNKPAACCKSDSQCPLPHDLQGPILVLQLIKCYTLGYHNLNLIKYFCTGLGNCKLLLLLLDVRTNVNNVHIIFTTR